MINIQLVYKMLKIKKFFLLVTYKKIANKIIRIFVKYNLIVFSLLFTQVYKTEFSNFLILLILTEVLIVISLQFANQLIELYPSVNEINIKYKKRMPYLLSIFLLLFIIFIFFEKYIQIFTCLIIFFVSIFRILTSQYLAFCYKGNINKKFIIYSEVIFSLIFIGSTFIEFKNLFDLLLCVLATKHILYFYNFRKNVYY